MVKFYFSPRHERRQGIAHKKIAKGAKDCFVLSGFTPTGVYLLCELVLSWFVDKSTEQPLILNGNTPI